MQKVEMTYAAHGTSALKAYPRTENDQRARIIAFPSSGSACCKDGGVSSCAPSAFSCENDMDAAPFAKPTRAQTLVAMALGIVFTYVVLFV